MSFLARRTLCIRRLAAVAMLGVLALALLALPASSPDARGGLQPDRTGKNDKAVAGRDVFHEVGRGDVVVSIVERGVLEAAQNTPLKCRLPARERGSTAASTIKKLFVEDGEEVKKGAKLVQLDDGFLRERIQAQEVVVAEKKALLERANKERDLAVAQDRLAVESAVDNVELAELDLKDAPADQKRKMEVRLRQARRALEASKLSAETRKANAEEAIVPRKKALEAAAAQFAELTQQLAQCELTAPHDGIAVFAVGEQGRFGLGNARVIAEGEPVLEGQILLSVADTRQMRLVTNVHEALIHHLAPAGAGGRPPMAPGAKIVVDAFRKTIDGHVQAISTIAKPPDWFSSDVKVYPVTIALEEQNKGGQLKPGMSAEVTIRVQERKDVLRVPVQAVARTRGRTVVYVKTEKGVEERELQLGAMNDLFAEVVSGLKEHEQVSLDPQAFKLLRGKDAAPREEGAAPRRAREIVVRGVRPDRDSPRAARIERYGLAEADLRRIEAVVPGVESVVPARFAPATFRVSGSHRSHVGRLVATTAGYAKLHDLARLLGDEDHRFLADSDADRLGQVAVLGSAVAQRLFPAEDPLGRTITVGATCFRVVGVLAMRPPVKGPAVPDNDVYVPLESVRRMMGTRTVFRQPGAFRAEEVDVHEAIVTVSDGRQVEPAIAVIRAQLERMHPEGNFVVTRQSGS
jgi:multidrug efflux pump subunit AcrA (membrane-fusion protein)